MAAVRENLGMRPSPNRSSAHRSLAPHGLAAGLLTVVLAACSTPASEVTAHPLDTAAATSGAANTSSALLLATLYANTSAEFAAATLGTYRSAQALLPALIADRRHTAALEQIGRFGDLLPAIVLDVDETVLDNSPSEVRLIEDGTSYPTGWDEWCLEASADAIPGAVEFTRFAAAQGVTVFYVTNRKEHLKEATARNLAARGFPMAAGVDTLLMRGGQPDWGSDKTSRRASIAERYRIVMMFGDNTGDFLGIGEAQGAPLARRSAMERHAERWGRDWFMLPNPMYGYWDGAVLDYDYARETAEIDTLRRKAMDPRR